MNYSTPESKPEKRLWLIDLLKPFSMISIVVFHFNEFIFEGDFHPLRAKTIFFNHVTYFSEYTSFSGQTIVSIASFLFGLRGFSPAGKDLVKLLGLFLVGYAVINMAYYNAEAFTKFYWDIYPFLFVACLTLLLIKDSRLLVGLCTVLGALLLIYPYQPWSQMEGEVLLTREVLWGYCTKSFTSSWPLFPWIGLVWLFFGLGRFIHWSKELRQRLSVMGRREGLLLGVLFAASLPFYCYFEGVPYGSSLYCAILQAPALTAWSYMFFIALVFRLAFVESVNRFCETNKILQIVLQSAWVKFFGPSYIFHILVLGVLAPFQTVIESSPWLFDGALLTVFLSVEGFGLTLNHLKSKKV